MKTSATLALLVLIGSGGTLHVAHSAVVVLETSETDIFRQWDIEGDLRLVPNFPVTVSDTFDVSLMLDEQSHFSTNWLYVLNQPDKVPATITATIKTSVDGFSGTSPPASVVANGSNSLVGLYGEGNIAKKELVGIVGPSLDVSIQANITGKFTAASFTNDNRVPSSVYWFQSRGLGPNDVENVAADGGAVNVHLMPATTQTTLAATGKTASGSSSLPWQSGAALLTAHSQGGDGNIDGKKVYDGAFGGPVSVTVGKGAKLEMNVEGQANSPTVGVLALSRGGQGGVVDTEAGKNGKGGTVDVTFSGELSGSKPYAMGVVAASVGSATQYPLVKDIPSSGGGSDVSLKMVGGKVNLSSTNSIGLIATSTAENPFGDSSGSFRDGPNSFRDVTVSLDAASSVSVGNTTDKATATDTTIGILASSAVSWASQPFLGAIDWAQGSSGKVGNVTINNQGSVSASGSGAIGILAQSIAGNGASASGGTRLFVGEAGAAGAPAGNVSYAGNGGSIAATGDGATGLLMQSIAGGGGNGGNAAGLFVAVGGRGGKGGDGGTVIFSQKNGASITTRGDYAQGVVMQSVGGGGGNGGHSKAYTVGDPFSVSIGGSGAIGGAGGTLVFGGAGASDTSSRITTSGRHAHGVVAHTIGSGGGKGGAAHSYNGSALLTVALGVGGDGGNGADGGDISGPGFIMPATSFGDVTTTGHDAHGMLLQSIGGGGGVGGGSTADAFSALSMPELPTINASFAIGGTGGTGGDGGFVWFDLANNMSTRGASSSGLVLQSIGGGGGVGGDATAGTAAFFASSEFTMNASLGIGGSGGGGGKGGQVELSLAGTQSTRGHNGAAVVAQSVGGGGGLGGVGNAATVVALPLEESTYQVDLGVGGTGGKGGTGGDVIISGSGNSVLTTLGSGASALVAQSVGGGGGVAGDAGTQGVGGKLTVKVAAGGDGGSGNHGGDVSVNYSGQITTGGHYQARYTSTSGGTALTTPIAVGGGSHGIVAQSVGGGGGMAGNADPSKSLLPDLAETIIEDANKLLDAKGTILWVASRVVDYQKEEHEFPKSYSVGVGVGGTGGSGGDGGEVDVTLRADTQILTHGHRSYGIFAQSVGGGGGEAGAASGDAILDAEADLSPLTGADFDFGLNVGGAGGAAGKGGKVTLDARNFGGASDQNNRIVTLGYGSHAAFLQSVGGGGGVGHEGSILGLGTKLAGAQVPDLTLGSASSAAGVSGDGGDLVFTADSVASKQVLIQTMGDDASAIFAQSVGGGGGLASAGCTNSGRAGTQGAGACHTNAGKATGNAAADATPQQFVNKQLQYQLTIAPVGAGANGGDVTINPPAGTLATAGDRSPVIVAQSIGGGGGYMAAHAANISATSIGHVDGGSGGSIYMGLGQVTLRAEGSGSWGILAQSVGSGGGVAGDLSGDLQFHGHGISSSRKSGTHGGDISISLTSGTQVQVGMGQSADGIVNAHGVVAQSLGSSGGIRSDGGNLVFDASRGPGHGYGGHVSVDVAPNASIETRAIGGVGILAHSAGAYANDKKEGIDISVSGGSVTGGITGRNPVTGKQLDGIGILTVGGAVEGAGFANSITVEPGGVVGTQGGADSGYAIKVLGGLTNVTNSGTITGSIDLGDTPGTLVNQAGGVLNKGAVYNVGDSSLHNYGTLNIGLASGVGTTVLNGRLNQYEGGLTVVTIDAANAQATNDRLVVNGVANVGGVLEVQANSLLPGSYTVLQASDLNFTGTVQDALLFDWSAEQQGESLALRPSARLGLAGLDASAASLAGYLQRGWLRSDAGKARVFGYLNQLGSLNQYRSTLQQLGGQQLHSQPQQMVAMAYDSFSDGMQCPLFQTPGVAMSQSGCAWARVTGNRSDQSARDYNLGYRSEGGGLRLGVQRDLGNQWRLGATFGANLNRLTADGFSSKGQVYDLSVSLSRQVGPWTFTGALAGAYGSFRNDRTPQLGAAGMALGLNSTYSSRSSTTLFGARLRAAYDIPFQSSYLRPYLDVDLLHTRSPSFSESNGPLGLTVGSVSKTQVVVSPMLEVGTRYDLSHDTVLRAYASAGVSVLPGNERTSQNRFTGALGAAGSFDSRLEGPSAVGRLNLGVQVLNKNGLELNAEYGLQAGGSFRSQTIGARLTYRF